MRAIELLLVLQIGCFLAIAAGFAAAAIPAFFIYVVLFHYALFYGLENVVFQTLLLFLSLRALDVETRLPDVFLGLALGLTLFSAAFAKFLDPVWRKGLGAFYFFSLPLWSRVRMDWAVTNRAVALGVNHGTIVLQATAFLILFVDLHVGAATIYSALILFSILLSSVFVMSWLGELLGIGCAFMVMACIRKFSAGDTIVSVILTEWPRLPISMEIAYCVIGILLLAGLYNSVLAMLVPARFIAFNAWMRTLARYSTGISVANVFTSREILGPVVFRAYLEDSSGTSCEVFKAFREHGYPGPYRTFRPTFVESIAPKVTEVAMELDQYGNVQTEWRRNLIQSFARFLAHGRPGTETVRFDLMQLIPPKAATRDRSWILSKHFQSAFRVSVKTGAIEVLRRPILEGPTGRELERASASFRENLGRSLY